MTVTVTITIFHRLTVYLMSSYLSIHDMLNRVEPGQMNQKCNSNKLEEHKQEHSESIEKNDGVEPNKKRAHFNDVEDRMLRYYVSVHGTNWVAIAKYLPNRTPRQCRDRWNNYLNPNISKEPWTAEEEKILLEKYEAYGPQWKVIASFLKNRSYNCVRNKFCSLQRQLQEISLK